MTLTIKTTLKDLLNSRFIIIYRFSPSLHKKRAVLPAKSSKPYSPKSSLLAFWLVTSITSCVSSPLICASFSATYFILRLSFLLPRLGSGVCLQNNSIHRYIRCCFHKLPGILKCKNTADSYRKAHVKKISCGFHAV